MNEILNRHQQFCDYSLTFKGNTPRTIKWLHDSMRYFLKSTNVQRLSQIDRTLIENYILKGKLEKSWSPYTIRNRLDAMHLFLDWCTKRKLIAFDPTLDIPLPKLPKSIPKHLTLSQSGELLEWTRNIKYAYKFERLRAVAVISTFIFTGIRLQELLNLNIDDIRFEDRSLLVRSGKGNKDRLIPLEDALIFTLRAYLEDRKRLNRTHHRLFLSLNADRPMSYQSIKRLVEKLRQKSGIHFSPHMLRHTFATLMLEGVFAP